VLTLLLVVVLALSAAAAAMVTLGPVRQDVGPVETKLSVVLSLRGGTEVAVPPVGRLMMETHSGPLRLRAGVEGVDPAAVGTIFRGGGSSVTAETATAEVLDGLRRLALRTSVVAVLASAIACALVFRRLRAVVVGSTATVLALGLTGGIAAATFETEAVTEPTYDGLLAQAPALVGSVTDARSAVDAYGGRVTQLADNVARLYGSLITLPDGPGPEATRVLWVSDIHNNPAAYRVMAALVEQFDVTAVVDTGDTTDLGSAPENLIHAPIARLGVPYLWVRGNHDSSVTQAYLASLPNVTVLDGGEVVEAAGIRWAGIGDPRYTPVKRVAGSTSAQRELLRDSGRELRDALEQQDSPVDVVLVHESPMAEPLLGTVPLVLDGHVHERREQRVDGTLELTQGSSGGAGLRTFDGEGALPLEMSILHFDPDDRSLITVDQITVAGVEEQLATFQRRGATSLAPADEE